MVRKRVLVRPVGECVYCAHRTTWAQTNQDGYLVPVCQRCLKVDHSEVKDFHDVRNLWYPARMVDIQDTDGLQHKLRDYMRATGLTKAGFYARLKRARRDGIEGAELEKLLLELNPRAKQGKP